MSQFNPEEQLSKLKNSAEPSEEFRMNLRNRIIALAKSNSAMAEQGKLERKNIMSKFFDKRFIFGLGTLAAVLIVAIILQTTSTPTGNTTAYKVAGKMAFGQLPSLIQGGAGGAKTPLGAGGDAAAAPAEM